MDNIMINKIKQKKQSKPKMTDFLVLRHPLTFKSVYYQIVIDAFDWMHVSVPFTFPSPCPPLPPSPDRQQSGPPNKIVVPLEVPSWWTWVFPFNFPWSLYGVLALGCFKVSGEKLNCNWCCISKVELIRIYILPLFYRLFHFRHFCQKSLYSFYFCRKNMCIKSVHKYLCFKNVHKLNSFILCDHFKHVKRNNRTSTKCSGQCGKLINSQLAWQPRTL